MPVPEGAGLHPDEYIAPRTEPEKHIGRIWQSVLGVKQVSLHDNFFNLGGHSLSSLMVIGQLERDTGVRVTPRTLLFGTLEQLAAEVAPKFAPPAPVELADEMARDTTVDGLPALRRESGDASRPGGNDGFPPPHRGSPPSAAAAPRGIASRVINKLRTTWSKGRGQ